MDQNVDDIILHGVTVIPLLNQEQLEYYHNGFFETFKNFPEYNNPSDPNTIYVLGAFGALGNPASFHAPIVRELRMFAHKTASDFFEYLHAGLKLEQLFDRVSVRRKDTKISAETWHRDQSPLRDPSKETVYGGWVNLDLNESQHFSCVPGTHADPNDGMGFYKIPAQCESKYRPKAKTFVIPPGHWIVFNQNIVHEIRANGCQKYTSLRLYLGWRITPFNEPLFNLNKHAIDIQGVPLIPSGQVPPMYSKNHESVWQKETIEWSLKTLKPCCIQERKPKYGETYRIAFRFLNSLAYYDLPLYPPYTDEEKKIMTPQPLLYDPVKSSSDESNNNVVDSEITQASKRTKKDDGKTEVDAPTYI